VAQKTIKPASVATDASLVLLMWTRSNHMKLAKVHHLKFRQIALQAIGAPTHAVAPAFCSDPNRSKAKMHLIQRFGSLQWRIWIEPF
jgi:hypothetical protein